MTRRSPMKTPTQPGMQAHVESGGHGAHPAGRLLLWLLPAGWLWGCEPSASSPVEPELRDAGPSAANSSVACPAEQYPILFKSTRGRPIPQPRLFLMRSDGSDAQLLSRSVATFHSPVWSPDGRSIAFRRRSPIREDGTLDAASAIGLMAPDGTEEILLTEDESAPDVLGLRTFDGPTWSPDGSRLAFASRRDSGRWAVWTMSRSGGQQQRLLPELADPHFNPSWARHDGSKLAFVAESNGVQDIWLVELSNPIRRENLTEDLTGDVLLSPDSPAWSLDGSRLAFSARDAPEGDDEVYVLELTTRELLQVTDNDSTDLNPAWSPDGGSLLISSNRLGLASGPSGSLLSQYLDLWQVSLDGAAEPVLLAPSGTLSSEADWYPAGSCEDVP